MAAFTDHDAKALADALNKYEPSDIHDALDAMSEAALRSSGESGSNRGAVTSGPLDFGSVDPGVIVYRTEGDTVRMRVTVAQMTGGMYDEIELPPDAFRGLVAALLETLAKKHAPHAP
jgi:hypothetical protein